MLELPGLVYETPASTHDKISSNPEAIQVQRYSIGDIGPGGGVVFYDAGSPKSWGQYLEAAPAGWSGLGGDPKVHWGERNLDVGGAVGTKIDRGAANTASMVGALSDGAGVLADSYDGGGRTDWFLPSKKQLNALYEVRRIVGGLDADYYWSSSQTDAKSAWAQHFPSGSQYNNFKFSPYGVRPVRAF
jgi:hypothetical protein